MPEARNRWHVLDESPDKKGLLLQNIHTNHEFDLSHDSIKNYTSPDLLVLRGQPIFKGDQFVRTEPFTEAPEPPEVEDPPDIIADREQVAIDDLKKLTEAERLAIRQLIVQGRMTDTDVSGFLEKQGFGPYPGFYQSVSIRVAFLEREWSGWYRVGAIWKSILLRLLTRPAAEHHSGKQDEPLSQALQQKDGEYTDEEVVLVQAMVL